MKTVEDCVRVWADHEDKSDPDFAAMLRAAAPTELRPGLWELAGAICEDGVTVPRVLFHNEQWYALVKVDLDHSRIPYFWFPMVVSLEKYEDTRDVDPEHFDIR